MHIRTEFGCLFVCLLSGGNHPRGDLGEYSFAMMAACQGRQEAEVARRIFMKSSRSLEESSSRLAPLGVWELAWHECTKSRICIFATHCDLTQRAVDVAQSPLSFYPHL
jgi:hypothetical protein